MCQKYAKWGYSIVFSLRPLYLDEIDQLHKKEWTGICLLNELR